MEYELWRYLTYSLGDTELTMTWSISLLFSVHRAALHLVCVLSVQLTIGVMMETVHGGAGGGIIIMIIRPVSDVRPGLDAWSTSSSIAYRSSPYSLGVHVATAPCMLQPWA